MENCQELLSVTTLRKRLDTGGPLSLDEASAIVDQVAGALDSIHLKGEVHGAVSPGNILLLPGNQAQLLSPKTTEKLSPIAARSGRTFTGDTLYLSPEEARGETRTAATDIWCLGTLLYEMLTGFPPFVALRLFMLREMVTSDEPDMLPQPLAAAQIIVDRALAKWPANRFISAQDMANKLWAVAPSQHIPVGTVAADATPPTPQAVPPTQPIQPTLPVVTLQQAVNRPFTLSSAPVALPIHSEISGARRWMRFFGVRKHTVSSAPA